MRTDVTFDSAGLKLAGYLYSPRPARRRPAPGGCTVAASATEHRIKAVATVSASDEGDIMALIRALCGIMRTGDGDAVVPDAWNGRVAGPG
ncbi:hypothetical protein [Streptomyces sp. NPDC051662]|uniref:hypothetical protein n=1 Tax=Streptomyces sp. NPDC051662 TaxID=3154750 RepID=UPI00341DC0D3